MFKEDIKALKEELKGKIQGKFMIRQTHKYKGLEERGIYRFNVYYELPTPNNRKLISTTAYEHGFKAYDQQIIEGSYGFVIQIEKGEFK